MHIAHQIILSPDEWEDFAGRLNCRGAWVHERMNSFFEHIQNDLSIRREAGRTIVESSGIDEEAILAAMTGKGVHAPGKLAAAEFTIHLSSVLVISDADVFLNQSASVDSYGTKLAKSWGNHEYTTIQSDASCLVVA